MSIITSQLSVVSNEVGIVNNRFGMRFILFFDDTIGNDDDNDDEPFWVEGGSPTIVDDTPVSLRIRSNIYEPPQSVVCVCVVTAVMHGLTIKWNLS
jgi:hypothetical protein